MRLIKLTLSYDGTAYAGWQVQPDQTTIQGALEAALAKVTGETVRVIGSGRTDTGVHALGQVAGFSTQCNLPIDTLHRAINAELPRDIAISETSEVREGFHPIRDALRKRYRYVIHDIADRDVFALRYCWHLRKRLDEGVMRLAIKHLVGKHDFSSFESSGSERVDSVRTVFDASVQRGRAGGFEKIVIEVEADGFLYNMVRAIVGTLVEVGRGAHDPSWVKEVLASRDRTVAGPTAPPEGLFLVSVDYENTQR